MYILLSGEGPSDIGRCDLGLSVCERAQFKEGPMTIMIDQLLEQYQSFELSYLECARISFVSESFLKESRPKRPRKKMSLRGKKKPRETRYFYENARALAIKAKGIAAEVNDVVIAILFRDSDGTVSAGRGLWMDKRTSIINGFKDEEFHFGVAMIPKPKSEAWLLCATKENPYQNCSAIENESGNDNSPKSLKEKLKHTLNEEPTTGCINELVTNKTIDVSQIDMPSFNAFKDDLKNIVNAVLHP